LGLCCTIISFWKMVKVLSTVFLWFLFRSIYFFFLSHESSCPLCRKVSLKPYHFSLGMFNINSTSFHLCLLLDYQRTHGFLQSQTFTFGGQPAVLNNSISLIMSFLGFEDDLMTLVLALILSYSLVSDLFGFI